MKKIVVLMIIILIAPFTVPVNVFAGSQSGGGFIVQDQINNSSSVSSGNGFTNQSGGSALSSQNISGGGFSSFGGAFRNSAATTTPPVPPAPLPTPTPTPAPITFGGSAFVVLSATNANNSIIGFPLTGITLLPITNLPLVSQAGQPPITLPPSGSDTSAIASTNNALPQNIALFDVVASPLPATNKNLPISIFIFIAAMLGIIIGAGIVIVKRHADKSKIQALDKSLNSKRYH